MIVALFTLLAHLFIFFIKLPESTPPSTPIELQEISPQRLEAIKQANRQRQLILSKNQKSTPNESPKEARYESDKNRRVDKETQASQTDVIPRIGTPGSAEKTPTEAPQKPKLKSAQRPDLSNLGIPLKNYMQNNPSQSRNITQQGGADFRDQAIQDKTLPFGDENLLNTYENKYYSFYARIYETIGPLWQSQVRYYLRSQPLQSGEYLTRVEVVLDPDGNVAQTMILISSGVASLDQVVVTAWNKVPRFPNPPKDLLGSDGYVHMGWSFVVSLDQSTGLPSLRPRRDY